MFNLLKKELKMNRMSLFLWIIGLCSINILAMLFFPAISSNMQMIKPFLESPMMKNIITAMVPDISNMENPLGFFVIYSGVFSLLLGSVFAISVSSKMLYQEEKEKTAEFLFAKPISRNGIFFGKYFAVMIMVFLIFTCFLLTSYMSLQFAEKDSAYMVYMTEYNRDKLLSSIEKSEMNLAGIFDRNEDSFNAYVLNTMYTQLDVEKDSMESAGFNTELIDELLVNLQESPESLFEEIRENPDKYSDMAGIQIPEDAFLKMIEDREKEYRILKEMFLNGEDKDGFDKLIISNPYFFLKQIKDSDLKKGELADKLGLNESLMKSIFMKYKPENLLIYSFYFLLLMILFSTAGFTISAFSSRNFSPFNISMGIVIVFYFLDTVTKAIPDAIKIGIVSPFRWVDNRVVSADYKLDIVYVLSFILVSLVLLLISNRVFSKKDVLV